MGIEELYSDEYLEQTYFNKKCTQCSNKCDKCTKDMVIERFYVRHRGLVIPTVIYKCNNFELKNE